MRQTKLIILLIAASGLLAAQTDPPGRVGRLNYVNGPASFQPAGVTDWVDAEVNRPLTTGDQVWVGDGGRAEIHVGSTAFRLDSNTAFQFLNLDDQTIQIQLSQGTLTVRVRNLAQDENLELDTPSLAFTVLRPGEYRIGADPNSETTTVTVRGGDGEVTAGGQAFPVHAGQQAIVAGGDQMTYDLVSAPGADGWDQWSSSRDRREDESLSARYVSREVDGYEDLDQYGSWANQPGYGQVWMPAAVAADWAPYHDGQWVWIAPWGWTWVDDAPWGFAPYHYGRWASFGGRWGWVPGPYGVTPLYAPALVGWIGGGSGFSVSFSFGNAAAVGWFPLGPREPYFPAYSVSSGYFGRVNNTNTVISSVTINNYYNYSRNPNDPGFNNIRYANRSVANAVTAVPQDRFANGRRVAESARAVPGAQLSTARYAAAPAIAPQRASVLGARAGEASRAPRPPASVLSRPVVARTTPPPAAMPFERQQAELNRNPGRPLAPVAVQQMDRNAPARSAPIRVQDMSRVQRIQPTVGAGPQPGARRVSPVPRVSGEVNPQPRNAQQQPNPAAPPVVNNRQSESPSTPAARQNDRWSTPVARPANANPRQQNAPPPNVVQQPSAPTPVINNRPSESPSDAAGRQNDRRAAPVVRPVSPPPVVDNRPSESPSTPAGRQNERRPAQTAKPDAPPPNAAPQRQNTPPPTVVQQPNAAPQPIRAQPEPRDRPAPPAQANRPVAQDLQRQVTQQVQQAPAKTTQPASRAKEAKGKPDKTDEKK